jgi:two-component system sensor histidine kinase PilS (NtrC family)
MTTRREDIVAETEQRRFELNISLLRVYNYYRLGIGLALLGAFAQGLIDTRIGTLLPFHFQLIALVYSAMNAATVVALPRLPQQWFRRQLVSAGVVLFDIAVLTALMYASGGLESGLGVMILISVAAGAILVTGRTSAFIAAFATIAILYEEAYLALSQDAYIGNFFQAGVLGAAYFATAIAIESLSSRLRRSEILSTTRAAEIASLELVNRSIIQRMRTGILVVSQDDEVRMLNQSARSLLGSARYGDAIENLPESLAERLLEWRNDNTLRGRPFQAGPNTPEIRANFSAVTAGRADGEVIIFIEDTTEIQQQAQQLKLAALGRLSSSIAHEIRNPLGAISHAAQLLRESDHLDRGDARLTDIIHDHCERMDGVIENVLELSRRRTPEPVRLNLANWLDEFVTSFRESDGTDADISIRVDPLDTEIRMDKLQLSQAVTNLAQNGLRYSEESTGRPSLELVGGVNPGTDRPFLNVVDHGRGVPPEEVKNLFEPFFTTERKGTGLGLYISREICEANQARLDYSRHQDGGSCFRITFAHPDRISALTGQDTSEDS